MKFCITKNKKNDLFPLVLGTLTVLIFFLYNYLKFMPIFLFGIAFLILCWLFLSFDQLFLLCVLLAPNIMSIKMIGSQTAWFGYFLLLVEIKYIFLNKFRISPIVLVHFMCAFVTCLLYFEVSLFVSLIRNIVFFVYIYSIFKQEELFQTKEYQKSILYHYLFGLVLNIVFGLIFWVLNGKDIFNGYFSGIRNDRNYYASLIVHGAGIVVLFIFQKSEKFSWTKCAFCFFLLFVGGLTGSRTFLLSAIFVVIEFLLLIIKPKNIRKGIIVLIGIGILVWLLRDMLFPVFEHIVDRFGEDNAKGGNGRIDLWKYYLGLTFSSIPRSLWGNGWAEKYVIQGKAPYVEHNTLVQAISTVGLLGAITFLGIYVEIYRSVVKKHEKKGLAAWMPLLSGLFFYMTISSFYSDQFNISILISFIAINFFSKDVEVGKGEIPLDNPQTYKRLKNDLSIE